MQRMANLFLESCPHEWHATMYTKFNKRCGHCEFMLLSFVTRYVIMLSFVTLSIIGCKVLRLGGAVHAETSQVCPQLLWE